MVWFWYFIFYSFLGFSLEIAYAWVTGGQKDRKCLLLLPLCPVYGLGACAILLLPPRVDSHPVLLFTLGGLAATGTEYFMAVFYERLLGVSFWDYSALPGSFEGRICPAFSLAWGLLSLMLVYGLHPPVSLWLTQIPTPVSLLALATLLADALLSCALLRQTGSRECLRWYAN